VIENENECKYGLELVYARPNRTYIEVWQFRKLFTQKL
jgi:hypothetical protein